MIQWCYTFICVAASALLGKASSALAIKLTRLSFCQEWRSAAASQIVIEGAEKTPWDEWHVLGIATLRTSFWVLVSPQPQNLFGLICVDLLNRHENAFGPLSGCSSLSWFSLSWLDNYHNLFNWSTNTQFVEMFLTFQQSTLCPPTGALLVLVTHSYSRSAY